MLRNLNILPRNAFYGHSYLSLIRVRALAGSVVKYNIQTLCLDIFCYTSAHKLLSVVSLGQANP